MHTQLLNPRTTLPALIDPALAGEDIVSWITGHRPEVIGLLREHGAVLFRGFHVLDGDRFQALAAAVCTSLYADNGEHDRSAVSPNVYTPVFYPPQKQLLWHNENSFNHQWPGKISFGCVQPAATGGETPMVDSRAIAARLDRGIYRRFLDKRVMYVRNYLPGLGSPWSQIFQTTDRQEAEGIGARQRMTLQWTAAGLKTVAVRPAIVRHPETHETVWFAQPLHWHPSCLDPNVRQVLLANYGAEGLPRDCRFGDGSPIDDSIIQELMALHRECEVVFPWERGDVAVLDNLLTAHARNPYSGERRLLVALGDMRSFDDVEEPGEA
jgi:alpha-ketoglutarate-dependent taurine dioxygenase